MTKPDIFEKIKEILMETFEIPAERITMEATFHPDLDLDSIDAVDLIVQLQQYTSQRINPEEFKQVRTIGDVVEVIARLVDAK